MPKIKFSQKSIAAIVPPNRGQTVYMDSNTPHLAIIARESGSKTFYYIRRINGKLYQIKIAACSEITLQQAQSVAHQKTLAATNGIPPEKPAESPTLAFAFAQWHRQANILGRSPKTIADTMARVNHYTPRRIMECPISHIRKAHYMYGWDWGAHLPDAGIFRPVSLCYVKNACLEEVYIRQRQEKEDWLLDFEVRSKEEREGAYRIQISACSPRGETYEAWTTPEGTGTLRIRDPQLWWVNGLGEQPLYQVRAVLYRNGEPEDCWERRLGLRKMTLRREKDRWGESFAHEINGIPFFAISLNKAAIMYVFPEPKDPVR